MHFRRDLLNIEKSLINIEKTGEYDVEKFCCSMLHLVTQLEYFYCKLVSEKGRDSKTTYYKLHNRPKEHQLVYFNIGRGFPKELMDGHWCYIVKDLGNKMLVIPCTSIKENNFICNPDFEMDIELEGYHEMGKSRLQLSDIRSLDVQRLDARKPFIDVATSKEHIFNFIFTHLFQHIFQK